MIIKTLDTLIELVKGKFPASILKKVDKLPGRITADVIKRFGVHQPAVYFAFMGGKAGNDDSAFAAINARFVAYVITNPEDSPVLVGPDKIIDVLVPLFHGHTIEDLGTLRLSSVDDLFTLNKDRINARVHAITFVIPGFSFSAQPDLSALNDFITYQAEHSLTDGDAEPEAIDHVTLDQ